MLNEGEKIYFISSGVEASFAESYFLGWSMYYINRTAFIFTTQRILLLQISRSGKPSQLKSQIRYSSIAKISRTIFGHCKIKFQNGKTSVFVYVPKRDKKFMQKVIEYLKDTNKVPAIDNIKWRENLCPYCYAVVEGFPQNCPHCQKAFKSANKAGWLSLIFPGLGDFYLGHRTFAILEILGASLVWFSFFISVFSPKEGEPMDAFALLLSGLVIFALMHGIDALVTRYVGRKGIYPSNK